MMMGVASLRRLALCVSFLTVQSFTRSVATRDVLEELDPDAEELAQHADHFVLHLAANQASFFDMCYEADATLFQKDPVASCGNAVKCFLKLFQDKSYSNRHVFFDEDVPNGESHEILASYGGTLTDDISKQVLTLYNGRTALRTASLNGLRRLEHHLALNDGKPRVFVPYINWRRLKKKGNALQLSSLQQNHVFIILKSSGTDNPVFQIIQAYRQQDYSRGYDVNDWLCSANKYARLGGIGKFTMSKFLFDLETFLTNRIFDAALFSDMFLVHEKYFDKQPYISAFTFQEVALDPSQVSGSKTGVMMVSRIGRMLQAFETTKKDQDKFLAACPNSTMVHGGQRLPGEGQLTRPGTLQGYGNREGDALSTEESRQRRQAALAWDQRHS